MNDERDVLLLCLDGSGTLTVDGAEHHLAAGIAVLVEKGARRGIRAGDDGLRYLTVHLRRPGLGVAPLRTEQG